MIGVSEFCKQPFMHTESVCTIAPFGGGGVKSAALTFYSMPRTLPKVLLDGKFWKKDASISFILRTN